MRFDELDEQERQTFFHLHGLGLALHAGGAQSVQEICSETGLDEGVVEGFLRVMTRRGLVVTLVAEDHELHGSTRPSRASDLWGWVLRLFTSPKRTVRYALTPTGTAHVQRNQALLMDSDWKHYDEHDDG